MTTKSSDLALRVDGRVFVASALLAVMFASLWLLTATLDALVRSRFGLSNADASIFFQLGTLASILVGLVVGLWSDRLGRRVPLIVVALGVGGITTALLPHMPTYGWLLAVRFLDSALGTVAITLLMTRGVDLSNVANRSRSMGVLMMAIPVGYLVGPALTVALGGLHLGWLFGVFGLMQLVGAVVAAGELGRAEDIQRMAPTLREMGAVLRSLPRTWMPMLFGMVDKFSFAAIALLTSMVLAEEGMGSLGVVGIALVLGAYSVAFIVANPVAGLLVARWGSRPTVIGASILYGIVFILLGSAGSVVTFTVLMALAGVLTAFQFVPNMTLVGDLSGRAHRATVMSVFNMLGSLAMLAGFFLLGHMSEISYGAAYRLTGWLEIGCGVAGLIGLGVIAAKKRRQTVGLEVPDRKVVTVERVP